MDVCTKLHMRHECLLGGYFIFISVEFKLHKGLPLCDGNCRRHGFVWNTERGVTRRNQLGRCPYYSVWKCCDANNHVSCLLIKHPSEDEEILDT